MECVMFRVHAKSDSDENYHCFMLIPYQNRSEIDLRRAVIEILMANGLRMISAELVREEV